jgi:hypothetical protein
VRLSLANLRKNIIAKVNKVDNNLVTLNVDTKEVVIVTVAGPVVVSKF